jgi:3',5'-nucleoside bisphosphate phosphatase
MGDKMLYADLHIHSNYSDGKLSPEEIVDLSIKRDIKCISITDHDNIDSQYIVNNYADNKYIKIVSGLELSSQYESTEIHILCYFIDIENENLKLSLNKIKKIRQERAEKIIQRLNEIKIDINIEDIDKQDYNRSVGRLHIAKLLVKKGYASSTKDAFQRYLVKDRPAFVERSKIDYKEALKLISDAKGIAVLAHPGEIYKNIFIEKVIKSLKIYGLKGIEVFHPSHSPKAVNDYYNLAKKYSLLITGGSDCHGISINADYRLGTIGMNEALTYKFLSYAAKKR